MEVIEVDFKPNKKKERYYINSRMLEEAKVLEARWAKHGLLKGIEDRFTRQVTAVLLEGQRLMNEKSL